MKKNRVLIEAKFDQPLDVGSDQADQIHTKEIEKPLTGKFNLYDISFIDSHQLRKININVTENSSGLESKFDQSSGVGSDQVKQIHTNEMKTDLTFKSKLYDVSLVDSHLLSEIQMNETENSSRLESKFEQSLDVGSDQVDQIFTKEMERDLTFQS